MAEDKSGCWCERCKKNTVAYRKGTNHVLHLLLTVFTLGLWLLFWFLASVKIGGWRCTQCGSQVSKVYSY